MTLRFSFKMSKITINVQLPEHLLSSQCFCCCLINIYSIITWNWEKKSYQIHTEVVISKYLAFLLNKLLIKIDQLLTLLLFPVSWILTDCFGACSHRALKWAEKVILCSCWVRFCLLNQLSQFYWGTMKLAYKCGLAKWTTKIYQIYRFLLRKSGLLTHLSPIDLVKCNNFHVQSNQVSWWRKREM